MICYHGTTKSNYESILQNGFDGAVVNTWRVSDDAVTYVYPLDKVISQNCLEDDDIEDQKDGAIRNAFESARIAAALQRSNDDCIVVLELDIDDALLSDDDSCQNMAGIASYVSNDDVTPANILHVYQSEYSRGLELFIAASVTGNTGGYPNMSLFKDYELRVIELISESDIYVEEIYETEYDELRN